MRRDPLRPWTSPPLRSARFAVRALTLSAPLLLLAMVWLRACPPEVAGAADAKPAAGGGVSAALALGMPGAEIELLDSPSPRALMMPVEGIDPSQLRDNFDDKRGGNRSHEAIDILAPRNTPVLAVTDGTVAKLWKSKPGGITLYQFDSAGLFCYYYAHLESYARGLKEGDTVRRGEIVGYVGTSGNAPRDAPHLHFAIYRLGADRRWWEGEPLNPYPLLRGAATSTD